MTLPELFATNPNAGNLSIFQPASPPADSIHSLFTLVLAVAAGIFLLVEGVLLYSLWRFRMGRGVGEHSSAGAKEPPQVYGSTPVEIAWTIFPGLIVFVLVLCVIRTDLEVRNDTPPEGSEPLFVTVVGHQWWWEYRYEKLGDRQLSFITANELHVPAATEDRRRPVYLTLLAADVNHSFWVPRLLGKTDLIPNKTNQTWFECSQPGVYLGQCAEFCGTQHANMLLRVYVDPPEKFAEWLDNQEAPAVESASVEAGRTKFLAQSCVNCHRVRRPTGFSPSGTFGPDLTHLMSRDTLGAGVLANNRDDLLRWVTNPQDIKPGCLMPAFGLSKDDWNLIVDYLHSLR
jgi:cytochrome c oxidase subunit 2